MQCDLLLLGERGRALVRRWAVVELPLLLLRVCPKWDVNTAALPHCRCLEDLKVLQNPGCLSATTRKFSSTMNYMKQLERVSVIFVQKQHA